MATVVIWNNNIVSAKFGMGHDTIGHAAMNITDTWVTYGTNNDIDYVSWWPDESNGGMASDSFLDDIKDEEGYAPDHVIRIARNALDLPVMLAAWQSIRTKNGANYKFYKKNCSTIVARVIRAGTKKGSLAKRHSALWTPLQVKRLALAVGGEELNWLDFVDELTGSVKDTSIAQLRFLKRRSSRHGFDGAAPPRFMNGKNTGKFKPVW